MGDQAFNVALIGYGLSAKVFQVPWVPLVPQFRLYAIVQRHPTPGDDAAIDFPDLRVYQSSEEMLKDDKIDLVCIGTASHTHYDLCRQALEAGKSVLCEKPFTITKTEADDVIALAAERKLLLSVFQNRRWDSDFLTVSSLVKSNKLGRIVEFESHFDNHAPLPRAGWEKTWRTKSGTGSGVVYDLGAHLIDQALVLFGMPEKVTGFLYHQRSVGEKYGDPDSMTVLLHYQDGLLVTLKASVMNPELEQLRYWIRGDKGAYKKYHLDCQEDQIVNGKFKPGDAEFGVEPSSHHGTLSYFAENDELRSSTYPTILPPTYKAFYQQLADALAGKVEVPVTPESARDVIYIIELVMESARSEKTVHV